MGIPMKSEKSYWEVHNLLSDDIAAKMIDADRAASTKTSKLGHNKCIDNFNFQGPFTQQKNTLS